MLLVYVLFYTVYSAQWLVKQHRSAWPPKKCFHGNQLQLLCIFRLIWIWGKTKQVYFKLHYVYTHFFKRTLCDLTWFSHKMFSSFIPRIYGKIKHLCECTRMCNPTELIQVYNILSKIKSITFWFTFHFKALSIKLTNKRRKLTVR